MIYFISSWQFENDCIYICLSDKWIPKYIFFFLFNVRDDKGQIEKLYKQQSCQSHIIQTYINK